MESNLIKAPIDNKNIMEDFTDIFHGGKYAEFTDGKLHKQTFYIEGVPFEIGYHLGFNHFYVMTLGELDNMNPVNFIREAVKELNTDNVFVRSGECGEDKRYCLSGCFYFVES